MKILLIDFYDSFTFNLMHYIESLQSDVKVVRHDEIKDVSILSEYTHVVLSPGPGMPDEKENMFEIIEYCDEQIHLLGVCLGMQAIGLYLGGQLENMDEVKHGVSAEVQSNGVGLFHNLPKRFLVGLYHSWMLVNLEKKYINAHLSNNKVIMAISDPSRKLYGVQYHPESILSENGKALISNFLNLK